MMAPAIGSTSSTQAAAVANNRNASELVFIALLREPVAKAANGLDHVRGDLLAQPADEHFDGVGIAIEVLLVEMLDELGARDDALVVMHQVGEQTILMRGQLDRLAIECHARGFGVEAQRTALDVALGVTGGAADLGTDAGEQLLHMERLG